MNTKKINIDPKEKLWKWGPIDSRPVYVDYWYHGLFKAKKIYGYGWPSFIMFFKKDQVTFVASHKDLYSNGEKLFDNFIMHDKEFVKNFSKWKKIEKKFDDIYKVIEKKKFSDLSYSEFKKLFFSWSSFYSIDFWSIGSLPELANWGGEKKIFEELGRGIINEHDFNSIIEKLSSPEKKSFYQQEEIDLLKIGLETNKRVAEKKIIKHQKKYHWIHINYYEPKILDVSYFKKELLKIKKKGKKYILNKIDSINNLGREAVINKRIIKNKYNLSSYLNKIGKRLSFCIWWQDRRKAYIMRAIYIIKLFLIEISERFNVDFDDLHYYVLDDLKNLYKNKHKISKKEIDKRRKYFLTIFSDSNKAYYFSGNKAKLIAAPYINTTDLKNKIKELKGMTVSPGNVKGRVRIIRGSKDLSSMRKGEILVSPMTSPEYIIALKKASAVVTDEGGITCHAAIITRELKIPGIVGTMFATQVLRDGDLVEVDANKGIIKKIK